MDMRKIIDALNNVSEPKKTSLNESTNFLLELMENKVYAEAYGEDNNQILGTMNGQTTIDGKNYKVTKKYNMLVSGNTRPKHEKVKYWKIVDKNGKQLEKIDNVHFAKEKKKVKENLKKVTENVTPIEPTFHVFPDSFDSGDAYDRTQTDENIHDGDVFYVPSEKMIGVLVEAWPVSMTYPCGSLHAATGGAHKLETMDGGKYAKSYQMGLEKIKEYGLELDDGQKEHPKEQPSREY